ncbi:hypothetical protein KC19_2G198300 [Ceratodon purpureus]|uniref:Protein kinase domain-containing protein n=1 Tax=Ceratodon purpureus TaxID=3225 RepID=A0A8T0IXG9_CERPU|nr:hypothetical protein KC19_2G198300 [Ceratodon purpureus]
MEKLDTYLKLTKHYMEAVQGMSSPKFNNEQCGYLIGKLEAVVHSASSFLKDSQAQPLDSCSIMDIARWVETFKLMLALARQVEGFVQGCCKNAWMQAAMTLANVAEYVSSLGFNLELCRIALSKKHTTGSLTSDEVDKLNKDETEIVEKKALVDAESLLKEATLELNSSKAEDCNLAKYLLHRLVRVGPKPNISDDDDNVLVKLFEWVTSGKKVKQLGRGGSAQVYKVMWFGTPVAKKTFHGPRNEEFLQEVKILSQLCHPNITSMFCCHVNKRSCSIIMELMDGNLHDLMQSRLEENSDSPPFSILEGVDIMLQVGEGVNYLHGKRIVHRDLKSLNILVKSVEVTELHLGYVQAKVVDFGLSKTKESSTTCSNMTYNIGTSRWMAPEVMKLVPSSQGGHGGYDSMPKDNYKCDIYSFALVCFEILTGEVPFQGEGTPKDIKKKVLEGLRPKLPDHCPSMLKDLIEKCWSQDPTKRPSIGDVCSQIRHLKYSLMTSNMFQGCYILHTMEPFEVIYLETKSLPWLKQVQVNIFSPFLKELLAISKGTISINGAQLFHSYEKVMERSVYCTAKLESSQPSSSAATNCYKEELLHITHLVRFMDKEFVEIKHMYADMEWKRCVTWEMLWAFFPQGERVVYHDKLTDKSILGVVSRTNYQDTQQGPMLFVKVINLPDSVTKRDSNSQIWRKYVFNKILHFPSKRKEEETWNKYVIITVPKFEGSWAICSLDIHPVRFEEDLEVSKYSFLHCRRMSIKEITECTNNIGPYSWMSGSYCTYGRVYYAQLQDRLAAIKVLNESAQPSSEFLLQLSHVSRLKHENVVELIGYRLDREMRVLAYEYTMLGSLHRILHGVHRTGPVLSWMERVKIAVGAARGLEYLHEKAIVHRGIRSRNILLYDSHCAKIDGFNFSNPEAFCKEVDLGYYRAYHPPEFATTGRWFQWTDVYGFGVVLLELLTGQDPVHVYKNSRGPRGQPYLVAWVSVL